MIKLSNFEIKQYMAFQDAMIKYEINAVVAIVKGNTALPRLKTEASAGFQQEFLQVGDDGLFEISFCVRRFLFQSEEFQYVRVSNKIGRI